MANKERLLQVRDAILAHKDRFKYAWIVGDRTDQGRDALPSELLHNCNTCGCVAGWTLAVANEDKGNPYHTEFRKTLA